MRPSSRDVLLESAEQSREERRTRPRRSRRLFSATIIATSCRRRATRSPGDGPCPQDRANLGLDLLAEEREQAGVDGVRLRQDPKGLAEAADAPRVHDDDPEAGLGELGDERALVAARRLDDDARGVERHELADELCDGARLVAGVLDLLLPSEVPLERVLSNVDSDTRGHGKLLRSNELGLYGLAKAAQAIVRASLRKWSGDPSLLTVSLGTQWLSVSRSGLEKAGG